MSDEIEQIVLADAASAAAEEPPKRRGIFGLPRRSKLPAKPLTHCENCGAQLAGEFCAQCGQHAIDYRRSILRVLWDAADSFLNWDTKFLHTLNQLLIRPWQLTNNFNAGRRARYVHPLRLYLIASIVFFLLARAIDWDSEGPIQLTAQDRTELVTSLTKMIEPDSPLTPEQRAQVELARVKLAAAEGALTKEERVELKNAMRTYIKSNVRKQLSAEERAKMATMMTRIPRMKEQTVPEVTPPAVPPTSHPSVAPPSPDHAPVPPVPIMPTPKVKAPFHISVGPEGETKPPFALWLEKQLKAKIGEDGSKAQLFLDTLRSNIPAMMLCCIPLFAFVLKMLYIRQRRFYVEHLVYALHVHTFLYVAVIIASVAVMGANRTMPAVAGWISGLMTIAIIVQIFLSIRRVYGQGWFMSLTKFLFGGLIYFVILVFAVTATAFVTLLLPS
ncbi:MAG TPA: DUF3667 domain-containing protein [Chthoniobacterales bacterium]|jgi:hypothetical protein|nr:DUF3667 domain-containing protein [Chthoniobacterales bacterium]